MAVAAVQPDMLSLLHHQHNYYTTQLGQTHQSLSKLYRKLFKTERALAEWKDRDLTRKDKKKLQWDRGTTKSKVRNLELQQACLHDYIHQCNDLIASYNYVNASAPATPWTAHMSPTAYPFTPYTATPPTPWTASPFEEHFAESSMPTRQYWDLSMLRERASSSTNTSADSGYHEPAMPGHLLSYGENLDPQHVYSHELIAASDMTPLSKRSSLSERDDVPELVTPTSPTRTGAEAPASLHRRRYSENAIQLIESRLGVPKEARVGSVPPSLERARAVSEGLQDGNYDASEV